MRIKTKGGTSFHKMYLEGIFCAGGMATKLKKSLLSKGLIEMRAKNHKTKLVFLTPKGIRVATNLMDITREMK